MFETWRASLKWQRLKRYEKLAEKIDRYWDGLPAYCKPESTTALEFVEGINKGIRVTKRLGDGLRDEEYPYLNVLTCMRDPI